MSASTHHTGTPLSAVLRIFGTGRGQNPPDIESTKPPTKRSSKRAQRKEQKLAKAQEEKIMKTEIQDCIVEQSDIVCVVSDYPTGYPQQAAFQSDLSFSVYRGFGYLHARILLQLQDELRVLETDLRDMDELDDNGTNKRVLSSRMKDETRARKAGKLMSDRAILLETIHDKLAKYDDFLLKTREINALEKPSDRDYISMRTWFCNMKPFSYQPEEEFIKRKRDLVTLRPNTEWGHFDEWIEEGIERLPTRIGRVHETPNTRLARSADSLGALLGKTIAARRSKFGCIPLFAIHHHKNDNHGYDSDSSGIAHNSDHNIIPGYVSRKIHRHY
ncbi:hypothetical protein HBH98_145160 [Parastagonospora nodorum]|nr:hypothetical protein HBH52_236500 [Parastagonospora nodorum]KAH3995369.1 hypothetical protein HBI10_171970 [Parastagonospora nodorum]KAH4016205.1 hypothetical protein HBI13_154790 [Parastagonospora nodorum]KAH4293377.1 hypothetical protein HBI01_172920 [Parastagonospora nodorum]KAH4295945.1 hypothetical protein HBI02_171740 [Parastagonospora nodorum]